MELDDDDNEVVLVLMIMMKMSRDDGRQTREDYRGLAQSLGSSVSSPSTWLSEVHSWGKNWRGEHHYPISFYIYGTTSSVTCWQNLFISFRSEQSKNLQSSCLSVAAWLEYCLCTTLHSVCRALQWHRQKPGGSKAHFSITMSCLTVEYKQWLGWRYELTFLASRQAWSGELRIS